MYNDLLNGDIRIKRNFLEEKIFIKLKKEIKNLKFKKMYQPIDRYFGNRLLAYPCYDALVPQWRDYFSLRLEDIIKQKINHKTFRIQARKTLSSELKLSPYNKRFGPVHHDHADLAGVFYFEQSYLGGTAFFENHFDPIPDITIGAYSNRLILYNGNRWHAPCADYTFEERYIIAFMVDIIK